MDNKNSVKQLALGENCFAMTNQLPGIKKTTIFKNWNSITVDLGEDIGYIEIMPYLNHEPDDDLTKHKITDIRIAVHANDNWYFDTPPGINIIVIKEQGQPSDNELKQPLFSR